MNTPRKSPEDIAALLYELCVDLGFCLPPEDHAELCAAPPANVDAFTDAVFEAEGMEPSQHDKLWRQVRERVARAFEDS